MFAYSEYDKGFIQTKLYEPHPFQWDIKLNENIVQTSLLTES